MFYLDKMLSRDDILLELAADYCTLFLRDQVSGALPYASIYLSNQELHDSEYAIKIGEMIKNCGFLLNEDFNDLGDHISIELEFFSRLIDLPNEGNHGKQTLSQNFFIDNILLSWLPEFASRCSKKDTFGFYSASAMLLLKFCEMDSYYTSLKMI